MPQLSSSHPADSRIDPAMAVPKLANAQLILRKCAEYECKSWKGSEKFRVGKSLRADVGDVASLLQNNIGDFCVFIRALRKSLVALRN